MSTLALAWASLGLLLVACGGSTGGSPPSTSGTSSEPPARRVSIYERATPYLADPDFWSRADLYVMTPDLLPLDRWPDEIDNPADYGIKIIVLLAGDYRGRAHAGGNDGWLYIPQSGTSAEPLLVTYASAAGVDIGNEPHPARRLGQSEVLLNAVRVIGNDYQVFHGLTFAHGFAGVLLFGAEHCVLDGCLWHETSGQALRIRFDAKHNLVQRCVMRRFDQSQWGFGDTVAIQLSDGACTHNQIISNVILNYTDAYQHTDRDGEPYGLGAGTLIDNNVMGFTEEAYLQEPEGELLCGENALDFKMGGTELEPVRITDNVFFGARASKAGCAASGSGGYAVTLQRRGTWIEMSGNVFIDNDSGLFLNTIFDDLEPANGRIDPHWTFTDNLFTGIHSYATAFPSRTGRVMSGLSPALFTGNVIVDTERLMDTEPFAGPWELSIRDNVLLGPIVLDPRSATQLEADGNVLMPAETGDQATLHIPWHDRTLSYRAAP